MLPIKTWFPLRHGTPPLKSELCDSFSHLSGGNDVLGLLRLGHKRPGPCAHSSRSAGSLVAPRSQKESLTPPREGARGVLWPAAAAPSQGRLQALLDLPLPRPSSPSIPSSGGSRRASSGRVVPTGSGITTAWRLFYATKSVMVSYVSQDPVASPPHTPVKSIQSNCRTGSFHIVLTLQKEWDFKADSTELLLL